MASLVIADDLIKRAQHGDAAAFATIVGTYEQPVFNYILRSVGDRGLAEDLSQEVFLRVYQSLPRFSFRSKFTTWLFQIAKNRVVDEFRSRERRPPPDELDHEGLRIVDAPVERAETIDAIWRAVAELPLDLRTALLLRDISGFSYDEIAEVVGATLAAVKWRIYRARELVVESVAAEGLIDAHEARLRSLARTG